MLGNGGCAVLSDVIVIYKNKKIIFYPYFRMDEKSDKGARIPRELIHEQHQRLSNKHIQTLSFLQEMANENKTLRERVKLLEVKKNNIRPNIYYFTILI